MNIKKAFIVTTILLVFLAALSGLLIGIAARFALFDIFISLAPTGEFVPETNILVLGVDSAFGHRSDTIMVLHVNPDKKEAFLISIPRDTIVTVPGRGLDKVNHAYAYGGVELSRQTAEDFLNIKIPYYVIINLAGIEEIIDKIGGVEINVEKRMYYVDYAGGLTIDLQPGRQKLNGRQVMGYLRFRHTDNDFARIGRQQKFLQTLASEMMKKESLFKSPGLFLALLSCIDTNMNSREIFGLSLSLRSAFEMKQFSATMIPGTDLMVDGIYYWKPDDIEVQKIVNRYLTNRRISAAGQGN